MPAKSSNKDGAAEVDAFLAGLKHPLKPVLQVLRPLILGVSKEISEGIKWNSPSFRTREWFATCNARGRDKVLLILHLGAKPRPETKTGIEVADPAGILKWLGKDRAMVAFESVEDLRAKSKALKVVIREWIKHV